MAGWYAGLLVLIALTLGLYEFVPRYEPSDRQILGNLDGGDLAGWWTMGSVRRDPRRSRSVVLEVAGAAAGASVLRRTVDLRTPATVILRAKIAADILESGDGSGGGAWLIVGNLAGSGPTSLYWEKGRTSPIWPRAVTAGGHWRRPRRCRLAAAFWRSRPGSGVTLEACCISPTSLCSTGIVGARATSLMAQYRVRSRALKDSRPAASTSPTCLFSLRQDAGNRPWRPRSMMRLNDQPDGPRGQKRLPADRIGT
jgi:hypothetical protein